MSYLGVGIRAATLLIKFGLVFFIGHYFTVEDFGSYGVFVSILTFSYLFFGLEIYQYTNRIFVRDLSIEGGGVGIFWVQLKLHIFLYTALSPIFILVVERYLPNISFYLIYFILVLSHLNQEFSRYLIAESKLNRATFVNFMRQAFWVVLAVPLMIGFPEFRDMTTLMVFWLFGELLAFFIVAFSDPIFLKKRDCGFGLTELIKNAFRIVVIYLFSLFFLRLIISGDRLLVEELFDDNVLGGYVFYGTVAFSVFALLEVAILLPAYPILIKLVHNQDYLNAFALFKSSVYRVIAFTGLVSAPTAIMSVYLSRFMNPAYEALSILALLFSLVVALLGLLSCCQYLLYAYGRDVQNLIGNAFAAVGCVFSILYIYLSGNLNEAFSIVLAVIFGLVIGLAVKAFMVRNIYLEKGF